MAIDAYTGRPRSGKSYSVVKNVILPSLREGRRVFTNIPLTELLHTEFPGLITQLDKDWFTDQELFDKIPAGAVCILDELWRRWPSGMKSNMVPFKDKEFLAEHGHNVDEFGNTTRVVLVSQDLSQIAAFARDLVDKTYRTTKLDAVGQDGRFRVDVYEGAVTGQKPPKSQQIRQLFDKYEDSVYRYYKSSTKSVTGEVGNESRADKRSNLLRSPWLIAQFVVPVLAIPFLLWYIGNFFFGRFGAEEPEPVAAVVEQPMVNPLPPEMQPRAAQQAQQQQIQTVPQQPAESPIWRVAGYIKRSDAASRKDGSMPDVILLTSAFNGMRHVVTTDCELYADGITWTCSVDGFTVTPWSGRGSNSQWANGRELAGRTAAAASGATEGTSSAGTVNPPPI